MDQNPFFSNCPSLFLYGNRKQNRHTLVCIFPLFWLYCTQQCVSTDIFYLSFSNSHSPTLSLSLCRSFSQYSAGNRNINKILSCWGVGLKHPPARIIYSHKDSYPLLHTRKCSIMSRMVGFGRCYFFPLVQFSVQHAKSRKREVWTRRTNF